MVVAHLPEACGVQSGEGAWACVQGCGEIALIMGMAHNCGSRLTSARLNNATRRVQKVCYTADLALLEELLCTPAYALQELLAKPQGASAYSAAKW